MLLAPKWSLELYSICQSAVVVGLRACGPVEDKEDATLLPLLKFRTAVTPSDEELPVLQLSLAVSVAAVLRLRLFCPAPVSALSIAAVGVVFEHQLAFCMCKPSFFSDCRWI